MQTKTLDLPLKKVERETRDRQLALAYVFNGEGYGVITELARETGFSRKTIHRAVNGQLNWARAQVPAQGGDSCSPSTKEGR
jgi:hypothetical protein